MVNSTDMKYTVEREVKEESIIMNRLKERENSANRTESFHIIA